MASNSRQNTGSTKYVHAKDWQSETARPKVLKKDVLHCVAAWLEVSTKVCVSIKHSQSRFILGAS